MDRLHVKVTDVIASKGMRVIGIDEAGYGPLLGPLVVTSVSMECRGDYESEAIWRAIGRDFGIADSKRVLSHRNMAPGESTTLALLSCLGVKPATRRELFETIVVDPPSFDGGNSEAAEFVPPCCSRRLRDAACDADEATLPRWGRPPERDLVDELRARLDRAGVRLHAARAVVLCPGRFNDALDRGINKADVNWRLFAHLLRLERSWLRPAGFAACGKLGGRSKYGSLLIDLGFSSVIEEGRRRSAYSLEDFGVVEFLRSAETEHVPVAMASMIGKLLREHVLDQWHQMFASHLAELETCSGYRDVVTRRQVERTTKIRAQLGIPDCCYLRKK